MYVHNRVNENQIKFQEVNLKGCSLDSNTKYASFLKAIETQNGSID